ncbi:Putative Dol-P-Glc:Glc(2)Man(9)GlcNAc(2)-PP-Dol alpha-1,2-glucosyltransferase [Toxocara canis]|uniref:Dol-P-Glc:Glc(2)Man(9)GlcNAc(2)-PP-Dol alpha-1,2-glucosyltransferase n=1 Tax=Toxocara canis TaxID=6265 RepID=A0A0B2VZ72_TOXCA|nr:Putative Dol-P-Glc:Glc(2)Man(9)GlcNAc(2)-PP-Dol alpha-1,2-glucosyltransferase [Toxocara canis]
MEGQQRKMAEDVGQLTLHQIRIYVLGATLCALHFFLVNLVYSYVPEPYMDEIFHINQTRRYCEGDYSWNEKITTPPALYLFTRTVFCGRERCVNTVLWPVGFIGAVQFRRLFTQSLLTSTAVLVMFLPVLYQSSLLFYTDLCSLATVLWGLSLRNTVASSLIFLVGVLTRQTNIVWAAIYGAYHLLRRIDIRHPHIIYVSTCATLLNLSPLLCLGGAFVVFFVLNGYSIVLGDRSAHDPVAHFMQLYYLFVFMCFSAAPYVLFSGAVFSAICSAMRRPIRSVLSCICIATCVYAFTMEHPYLLADNRHFTFYVWRRWFHRHWACKYVLVPVYLIAAKTLARSIRHVPRLPVLLYVIATTAVLVPARLLEPRYFIVSYVLWRLSVREKRLWIVLLEIVYQVCINFIVLYLFIDKPFEWVNQRGVKQRFMW